MVSLKDLSGKEPKKDLGKDSNWVVYILHDRASQTHVGTSSPTDATVDAGGTVHTAIRRDLVRREICSCFVAYMLTDNQKANKI